MATSPAELRTKRQGIGLTPKHIAARAGVHHNVVWRAESPISASRVNERVDTALTELEATFYEAIHAEERASRKRGHIARARDADEFEALHPTLAGWPDRSIGLFYAELRRRTGLPIQYIEE